MWPWLVLAAGKECVVEWGEGIGLALAEALKWTNHGITRQHAVSRGRPSSGKLCRSATGRRGRAKVTGLFRKTRGCRSHLAQSQVRANAAVLGRDEAIREERLPRGTGSASARVISGSCSYTVSIWSGHATGEGISRAGEPGWNAACLSLQRACPPIRDCDISCRLCNAVPHRVLWCCGCRPDPG